MSDFFAPCSYRPLGWDWGTYHASNASWTGMIGRMLDGEASMIGTSILMTADRSDFVDYLWPITLTTEVLMVKRTKVYDFWDAAKVFSEPFVGVLWIALLAASLVITAVLVVWTVFVVSSGRVAMSASDVWFYWVSVFLAFFGKAIPNVFAGGDRVPVKITVLCVSAAGLMTFICYRASLISKLTTVELKVPFSDLYGLYEKEFR